VPGLVALTLFALALTQVDYAYAGRASGGCTSSIP